MAESTYDRKREFDSTPEPPMGPLGDDVDPLTAPTGSQFVIQQHYATALHHDVRLEMLNDSTPVLVSWAVPKGLPRQRGRKALAIRTEDHPMAYATFSGPIGEGYGAGEVRIFDSGIYEMVGRSDDRITFRLDGERLQGIYHLVHTGRRKGKEEWLGLMSEDLRPESEPRPPPEPMQATVAGEVFDDPGWGFEPQWDGKRVIAFCDETTRLLSSDELDLTEAFPELAALHNRVVGLEAMIDGVIIAFEDGVPSSARLHSRMQADPSQVEHLAKTVPVTFMAFDLLYLDGRDLTALPLSERIDLLDGTVVPNDRMAVSPPVIAEGKALLAAARQQELPGIVAKRLASPYVPGGRSKDWLQIHSP